MVKVPSLGAVVQYVDVDGHSEPHEGIIVKHIDDKCDSILVDKKSHCRRLVCITTHTRHIAESGLVICLCHWPVVNYIVVINLRSILTVT